MKRLVAEEYELIGPNSPRGIFERCVIQVVHLRIGMIGT